MKRLTSLPLPLALILILFFSGACGSSDDDDDDTTTSSNTICLRLATDSSDDIYVGGYTSTNLNSDVIIGEDDIFLIKYASDNRQVWSNLVGTTDYDNAQGMAVTASDQVLITGYTYAALDNNTSAGGVDMILLQSAPDNNITLRKQYGSSLNDYAYGIALDSSGNIFIAGHTYGSFPGSGTTMSGTKDFVLIKLDSAGRQLWSRQISNDEDNSYSSVNGVYGIDASTDSAGNIYAAGFTTGDLPDNTSADGYDLFVTKYDSLGNRLWITQFGSDNDDYTQSLQVTAAGDVYICGYTSGALPNNTAAGGQDIFLAKLDTNGRVQWITQTGTEEDEKANGIALDSSGKIWLTGYTNGSLAGTALGGYDLVLMKYDTDGKALWQNQTGTANSEVARDIALDSSDNIYLTGYTYGQLDGQSNASFVYYSFISKYNPSGTQVWTDLF